MDHVENEIYPEEELNAEKRIPWIVSVMLLVFGLLFVGLIFYNF